MASRFGRFALAPALAAAIALAVPQQSAAQAVVQAVPPPALGDLQAALSVLARNPQDFAALMRAGMASLELDDPQAALGFFRRAEAIDPANGQLKAGLAALELRQGNPVQAVHLFAQAEAAGVSLARFAGDRGLALDLVGSNLAAQQYYREALRRGNDPEIVRRLALSQAIAGDRDGSEATLLPLLQRSDLAAYRARAFALAILGESDEAIAIAEAMLPSLASRMAPYLRYMPRLTRAQQAAAANLGRFPAAGEIGRDSPEIAALSGEAGPPQAAARTPDSRLAPAGPPLGAAQPSSRRTRQRNTREEPRQERLAVGRVAEVTTTPLEPAPAPSEPGPSEPPPDAVVVAVAEPAAAPPAQSLPPAEQEVPRPSFSIADPVASEPAPDQAPLAEAFAEFSLPPGDAARPPVGAVDITTIVPPRERREQAAPAPPAHPRRYWVQVATGRDVDALGWDWRRISRKAGELLAGKEGFTASWGQTNRLVTGPYASVSAAQQAVTDLKGKGVDSFAFTSAAGEEVTPLR